jgi:hypothetical protein
MLRFGGGDKGWNTGIVPLVVELDKGSKGILLWLAVRPEAQTVSRVVTYKSILELGILISPT